MWKINHNVIRIMTPLKSIFSIAKSIEISFCTQTIFESSDSFAAKSFLDHLWIIMSALSARSARQSANIPSSDVSGTDPLTKRKNMKRRAPIPRVNTN